MGDSFWRSSRPGVDAAVHASPRPALLCRALLLGIVRVGSTQCQEETNQEETNQVETNQVETKQVETKQWKWTGEKVSCGGGGLPW